MGKRYVGVYWTLPVNWAGFRGLPPDVDAAAAASRIIRYQRERVRGWVRDEGGALLGEVAFTDTRTDRATDAVRDVLRRPMPARARRWWPFGSTRSTTGDTTRSCTGRQGSLGWR